ncbi:MAG: acetyl-CoA C-acetyltransferase [Anaerolineae bacterium]
MNSAHDILVVSACRTPMGRFLGNLSPLTAPELGAVAIAGAIKRAGIDPNLVDEVLMGNVVAAGQGQAPARQAAMGAGLPPQVSATTINKVCGSGLKAVALGTAMIRAGDAEIIVAGGMESMSNTPYLLPKARTGYRLGDGQLKDAMVHDGLWCAFEHHHMGVSAEFIAEQFGISREEMDEFAVQSHQKAVAAMQSGRFEPEIVPVEVPQAKGPPRLIDVDEGPRPDTNLDALARLKPVFKEDGRVTAGNSSGLSDGASALVLMSRRKADELGVTPLACITGFAQAAVEPLWLFIAPVHAVRKLYDRTGLRQEQVHLFEINEAFASQMLADGRELGLKWEAVNVSGGAIALGHPIGCSGARILTTLIYNLKHHNLKTGLASLCLGGGEAVAMSVEIE